MIKSKPFLKAKRLLEEKHKGQVRKNGEPYVNHPIRVADIVLKYCVAPRAEEFAVAALLHDVLEDSDSGISELRKDFGEFVTLLVLEMTADKYASGNLGKTKYLCKKLSDKRYISGWALIIKLADRLDNVSDLNVLDKEFARRYKAQTLDILNALEKKRELYKTHVRLIKAIREKLDEVRA